MQNKRQGFLFSLLRRILFSPRGGKISESREEYKINLNLFLFPSNELGNTQNEAPNNNFAKPLAWGSQHPQPLLALRRGHYGQKPVKIGCASAN
ncbi:MAG: hypothetical protein IKH02_13775 [Prevotella sp.]|nr:hypothetical protein [Prevotella sp.]